MHAHTRTIIATRTLYVASAAVWEWHGCKLHRNAAGQQISTATHPHAPRTRLWNVSIIVSRPSVQLQL